MLQTRQATAQYLITENSRAEKQQKTFPSMGMANSEKYAHENRIAIYGVK